MKLRKLSKENIDDKKDDCIVAKNIFIKDNEKEISNKTLIRMDETIGNYKKGIVSEPIVLK